VNTDVVSLDVEVSEGDGDAVLWRRHNQPDAVLIGRVDARIERTRYRPVCSVDVTATRVCRTVHNTCITVCMYENIRTCIYCRVARCGGRSPCPVKLGELPRG